MSIESFRNNLDLILAKLGLIIFFTILVLSILIFKEAYKFLEAPLLFSIICGVYIVSRANFFKYGFAPRNRLESKKTIIAFNILFVILFLFSIYSLFFPSEVYNRPLLYLVASSSVLSLLAIEIVFLKTNTNLLLFKIILIAISLRWTPQALYPGLVGIDPWWHQYFTNSILELGIIPEELAYSKLPIMHLLIGSVMIITDLNYKISAIFSVSLMQILTLVFIFLLGSFIFNKRVGLLSTLLLAIAETHIELGFVIRPISLGTLFMSILIYLIVINSFKLSNNIIVIKILLSFIIILTHTISSVITLLISFSFYVGALIYAKIKCTEFKPILNFGFLILFFIAMFSWWTYASGHIFQLGKLIAWGFSLKDVDGVYETSISHININIYEYLLSILGFNIYLASSILGIIYITSNKVKNENAFSLSVASCIIFSIIFISLFGGRLELLPVRWYPSLQILLSIPLAVSLLLIANIFKSKFNIIFISLMVFILSTLSIVSPLSNMDYDLYPNMIIRSGFTVSEISALNFANIIYKGILSSDRYTEYYFKYSLNRSSDWNVLTPYLLSRNYESLNNTLVLLRKEIIIHPFSDTRLLRLDYDPQTLFLKFKFLKIYDSGTSFFYMHA